MSDIKRELNEKIAALRNQLWAIEHAEQDAVNAALVGRYFRERDCYSCPESDEDYWYRYTLVLGVDDGSLKVLMFYTDKYGASKVSIDDCHPPSCLGDEISAEAFGDAKAEFLARVTADLATDPTP